MFLGSEDSHTQLGYPAVYFIQPQQEIIRKSPQFIHSIYIESQILKGNEEIDVEFRYRAMRDNPTELFSGHGTHYSLIINKQSQPNSGLKIESSK